VRPAKQNKTTNGTTHCFWESFSLLSVTPASCVFLLLLSLVDVVVVVVVFCQSPIRDVFTCKGISVLIYVWSFLFVSLS